MLIYNIKLALKKIKKHQGLTIINVLGLSVAMAFCIIIMLFLQNELGYDKHHSNHDRLYRISSSFDFSGSVKHMARTSGNAGKEFSDEIPEIESHIRIFKPGYANGFVVEYKDDKIEDKGIMYADSNFFNILSYQFVYGNAKNALAKNNSVVISKSVCEKLFGEYNPIGQELTFLNIGLDQIFQISAVVNDEKSKSHLNFNYLFSFKLLKPESSEFLNNWLKFPIYTYISLHKNTNQNLLPQKMQDVFRKNAGEYADKWGAKVDFKLQPITDIHLKSNLDYELGVNGDISYVYYFSIIGLLILIVAIINFINLVTANSYSRANEVGLRKVFGGNRKQLIRQFLNESMLLSFVSLLFSICIVIVLLPIYNQLSGLKFTEAHVLQTNIIIGIVLIWLISGFGAGFYPAFVMSSQKIITNLKGDTNGGIDKNCFVKSLVIFQFAISITLIACTIIILKQVNYLQNVKMSFNPEKTLIIKIKGRETSEKSTNIKSELLKNPDISAVSFSYTYPGLTANFDNAYFLDETNENATVILRNQFVDFDYIDFYNLKIVDGRNFNSKLHSDSTNSFILNETALKLLDITGSAIGKKLNNASRSTDGVIIGVIEDFHQESLKNNFVPLIYKTIHNRGSYLSVKINTQNTTKTISWIEDLWATFEPHRNMEYFFLDQYYNQLYKNEKNMGSIFLIISIITIIIASLGLFSLVSFITFKRTKEIGIRRVNGAKKHEIIKMLNAEFLKWVAIAYLIAIPIAYLAMNKWLQNFAYKTELSWWIFALAGIIAMGIALLTVSFQSWRAATRTPVESLRYE